MLASCVVGPIPRTRETAVAPTAASTADRTDTDVGGMAVCTGVCGSAVLAGVGATGVSLFGRVGPTTQLATMNAASSVLAGQKCRLMAEYYRGLAAKHLRLLPKCQAF